MAERGTVLILAGTREAREVCGACGGLNVLASVAGVTRGPRDLGVPMRIGGFAGDAGFAQALAGVTAVLDATHPFAATMTERAVRICATAGVPYLRLTRRGWTGGTRHPDAGAAAAALPGGARVFLATGPGSVDAFLGRGLILHCRRIDPAPTRDGVRWIVGRPPFARAAERALLERLAITHLVAKDSGGDRAKLDAAATLGVAVHIIDRPPAARGEETHDVQRAIAFVEHHAGPAAR